MARQLVQADAVILDELGYLPFPASGGALLFHLISHLAVTMNFGPAVLMNSGPPPAV